MTLLKPEANYPEHLAMPVNERNRHKKDINYTKEEFSPNTRILLSHKWNLENSLKRHLNYLGYYYTDISVFLRNCVVHDSKPWSYLFTSPATLVGMTRQCKNHFYTIQHFFTSQEHFMNVYDDWREGSQIEPEPTVSFSIRRNIANNFFLCLVKLNEAGWDESKCPGNYEFYEEIFGLESINKEGGQK